MTILVVGATGNVGRHVLAGLDAAGEDVRGLSRSGGPGLVAGSLPDLPVEVLDGVDRVFLLWPTTNAEGAQAVAELLARHVRHVVYLSAIGGGAFHAEVEEQLRRSGVAWTFLRAGGFATNTLGWADDVRAGVVRWAYGEGGRSLIHQRDIADVAVAALTQPGHEGATYDLTGPSVVTQIEQVRLIGEAAGVDVRWEEIPGDELLKSLVGQGWDPEFATGAVGYWASLVTNPETTTNGVAEITGHPARTFAEWAAEHADDFR